MRQPNPLSESWTGTKRWLTIGGNDRVNYVDSRNPSEERASSTKRQAQLLEKDVLAIVQNQPLREIKEVNLVSGIAEVEGTRS